MRREFVYGDWDDLRFEENMLRLTLRDSPSLARTAAARIKEASGSLGARRNSMAKAGGRPDAHGRRSKRCVGL